MMTQPVRVSQKNQAFLNRRNRLFSQRRHPSHNGHRSRVNNHSESGRTRSLKFPSKLNSVSLSSPGAHARSALVQPPRLPHARLSFRNDLSSQRRSLGGGGRSRARKVTRPRGPPKVPLLGGHVRSGPDPSNEVFFVKLEDGFFGCQVNETVDVLQLFEISKLCDGSSQCWQGSDENNPRLKCTSKSISTHNQGADGSEPKSKCNVMPFRRKL